MNDWPLTFRYRTPYDIFIADLGPLAGDSQKQLKPSAQKQPLVTGNSRFIAGAVLFGGRMNTHGIHVINRTANWIEGVDIRLIEAIPGQVVVRFGSQQTNARDPSAVRVRYMTIVDRRGLEQLRDAAALAISQLPLRGAT